MKKLRTVKSNKLKVRKSNNDLDFYNHQSESYKKLTEFYFEEKKKSGVLVIPTAGGKTHLATSWLYEHLVNNNKKVIWLGHFNYLLEEAVNAFKENCNKEHLPDRNEIAIKVVSSSSEHKKVADINKDDDIIIACKQMLLNKLELFKQNFLDHIDEVFIVIDEAQRGVAATYKKLLEFINENVDNVTILGLTATPIRSSAKESLLEVFYDDIIYSADLFDLMKQGVIATPGFISIDTEKSFNRNEYKYSNIIENIDNIPFEHKIKLAYHHCLNPIIVQSYNKAEHGKTIVFAIDQQHAVELTELFNRSGNKAKHVISNSSESEIRKVIDEFKANQFDILVNVNILAEGVNYPDVKSIFLTRPTSSKILFNQMMGRALRGVKAGGTSNANIVCFINNWESLISWTSPKSLVGICPKVINGKKKRVNNKRSQKIKYDTEGFTKLLCENVDIQNLIIEKAERKVPAGWYDIDFNDQSKKVIVYESQEKQYIELCRWLPLLCEYEGYNIPNQKLFDDFLIKLTDIIPNVNTTDVSFFMSYYLLNGTAPKFHSIKPKNVVVDILKEYGKVA